MTDEVFLKEWRKSEFSLQRLSANPNRLPVGIVTTEDEVLRDITFRKLSREDLKMIWDQKFSRNHPMQWAARAMCLVVESIAGNPVYEVFKAGRMKADKAPDVVQEIPLPDTSYVLMMGHIFNFGWEIKDIKTRCIDEICERKQTIPVLNLSNLMVEVDEGNYHHFSIELEDGLQIPSVENENNLIPHHIIRMRMPVVRDALKYEMHHRPNDQGDFYERIYGDCIEGIQTSGGDEVEKERIQAIATPLLKKMTANDSAILEGTLNNGVPSLIMLVQEQCRNCSEDLPVIVSQGFLYPKRR